MMFADDRIIPYIGTDSFKLGDTLDCVRTFLKINKVGFDQKVDPNNGCTPDIPWTFIKIRNGITLCFVMDILFEMVLEKDYLGKLPNGGCIGMKIAEFEEIDSSLEYNDEDEDYISKQGYWVTDNIDTGEVDSITVFLPEVERNDFFKYEWVSKYK